MSGSRLHSASPRRRGAEIFAALEAPSRAPWLRFSAARLDLEAEPYEPGQLLLCGRDDPVALLSMTRIDWDGQLSTLPTWDELAADASRSPRGAHRRQHARAPVGERAVGRQGGFRRSRASNPRRWCVVDDRRVRRLRAGEQAPAEQLATSTPPGRRGETGYVVSRRRHRHSGLHREQRLGPHHLLTSSGRTRS